MIPRIFRVRMSDGSGHIIYAESDTEAMCKADMVKVNPSAHVVGSEEL